MAKGPRTLRITFGAETLTSYGGVYLLHRFLTRIGFTHALAQDIRLVHRNNRYSVGELFLAVLYPMILGLERIETTQLLRQNGVFQYLTGLPRYPEATTLRRFLRRVAPDGLPRLRALHDRLLRRMLCQPRRPSRLIFDVDSTVLVVYGKPEGARIGYNPLQRGRPSYHPLLCFEGQSKDFWHGELRAGDAHTATGTRELLAACFAKIPAGVRLVIVRADKGCYDPTLVAGLEVRRARFVIVARLPAPITRTLPHLRDVSPSRGIEVAGFRYQPLRWPHPYRFVVVRRLPPEEPTDPMTLFKLGRYHYQGLVTNLPLRPLNLWRFYNDRAGVELLIKPLKGDYAMGNIPTRHFFANETYFHLLLLAYNRVNWFRRLCVPEEFQRATLQTLRNKILLMPAQLLRTGNRPRLALPASGTRQAAWEYALQKIEHLKL
jgi:hypothetical protein